VAIPKKIRDFLNKNKDAPREKILKGLVDTFKIKETTAITYKKYRSLYEVRECDIESNSGEALKREKFLFDDSRL
jgi:hypothetical protein